MMENLADLYFAKLKSTTAPGKTLAYFYRELFEVEPTRAEIIGFNKLVKMYGRERVFFAVLDLYDATNVDLSRFPYGLLVYIIKDKMQKENMINVGDSYEDLTPLIRKVQRDIEDAKNRDIEIPGYDEIQRSNSGSTTGETD